MNVLKPTQNAPSSSWVRRWEGICRDLSGIKSLSILNPKADCRHLNATQRPTSKRLRSIHTKSLTVHACLSDSHKVFTWPEQNSILNWCHLKNSLTNLKGSLSYCWQPRSQFFLPFSFMQHMLCVNIGWFMNQSDGNYNWRRRKKQLHTDLLKLFI